MSYELSTARAVTRFNLSSLSELWMLYTFDFLLAHAPGRTRGEVWILVIILVSRRTFNCSRRVSDLFKIVITLEV